MSMDEYLVPTKDAEAEFVEKRSWFIGHIWHTETEEEALAWIKKMREQYWDATHNVYAYIIKDGPTRFSDDGEPGGTAGMPVLDVLQREGIYNVLCVVTRYFGGTLLGTGGLVHAYGSSAVGALEAAEIITYDTYTEFSVEVSYSDYQRVLPIIEAAGVRVLNTDYLENVTVMGRIKKEKTEGLFETIRESTSARADCKIIREIYDF